MKNKFWTPRTTAFIVIFLTFCSIIGNGLADTAYFFTIFLGTYVSYKLIAKEKIG